MLNMLPKFELVPISRYFITLPKACAAFEDAARGERRRPCSSRMISAASLATSTAPATPKCPRRRHAAKARR